MAKYAYVDSALGTSVTDTTFTSLQAVAFGTGSLTAANCYASVTTAAANGALGVGDFILLANDSAESYGANTTITIPDGVTVMSVDATDGSVYLAGAQILTTAGVYDLHLNSSNSDGGTAYFYGLNLLSGDDLEPCRSDGVTFVYTDCLLKTGASSDLFRVATDGQHLMLNNCEIEFQSTNSYIDIQGGSYVQADNLTITAPINIVNPILIGSYGGGRIDIGNSDLSNLTIVNDLIRTRYGIDTEDNNYANVRRVKTGSWDIFNDQTVRHGMFFNSWGCGTADQYYAIDVKREEGNILESITVVRTGGASIDGTALSIEFQPNAGVAELSQPLRYMLSAPTIDLSGAGGAIIEIHILLQDSAGTPTSLTDMNCVLKAVYPDATDLALGKTVSSTTKDVLDTPANLASETVTFTGTTGTTKQHKRSVTIPQNASMDAAVCELWLELSVDIPATTEMFVCPAHSIG